MSYLSDWAEQVKIRDKNCVICGSKQNLDAHHIFKVNKYDDAYLDLNNGVALCEKCHNRYHNKYGLDCSIKNLLELKRQMTTPKCEKLKMKCDFLCNKVEKLEKKNKKLKKKNNKLRKKIRDLKED